MSFTCDRCGKGRMIGRNVSHSKIRTRKISRPNLQTYRGILNGRLGKWKLCTKCLRKTKEERKKQETGKPKEQKTEKPKKEVAKQETRKKQTKPTKNSE